MLFEIEDNGSIENCKEKLIEIEKAKHYAGMFSNKYPSYNEMYEQVQCKICLVELEDISRNTLINHLLKHFTRICINKECRRTNHNSFIVLKNRARFRNHYEIQHHEELDPEVFFVLCVLCLKLLISSQKKQKSFFHLSHF